MAAEASNAVETGIKTKLVRVVQETAFKSIASPTPTSMNTTDDHQMLVY